MSLPYFVESGDYIIDPQCVARLRRIRAPDAPVIVRIRLKLSDGPDEELAGEDAVRLFDAFRALAALPGVSPAGPPERPGPEGLDAVDSIGDGPEVERCDVGDDASRAE